jgi:MscS family membrane protein
MDALAERLSPYIENPWMLSLGIFILSLVLTVVVRWSLRFILHTVAQKTDTDVDNILVRAAKKVVTYTIPIVGLMVALTPLALPTLIPQRMLFSLLAVLLMRSATKLVDDLSKWLERTAAQRTASSLDEGLLPLLRKTLKASIIILGVLIILGKWGVQIGPLVGALGIGGLAIALALNSSLSNVFSGIQLILDRSINVGDKVKLESGDVGIVLDIGLRSTRMRTFDNEVISLPNSQLANAQVKNYTKPDSTIRVGVNFGVAYGSDVAEVKRVVLDVIKQLDDIMLEPEPQVLFLNMSDFSLDMCARVWVDDYGKQFATKLAMTELVYNTLNNTGIEIPFPTRTVYMKQ